MTELTNRSSKESTPCTARPQYKSTTNKLGVLVSVDLAGVAKQDITITSEKQQLKIQAQRSDSTPEEWNLINNSARPTNYELVLNIHQDLDLDKTAAQVENGVLSIQIDRRDESLPRLIKIDQ